MKLPRLSGPRPQPNRTPPPTPDWRLFFTILVGGLLIAPLAYQVPNLGVDWVQYYSQRLGGWQYPPWPLLVIRPLTYLPTFVGLAIVVGWTLVAPAFITYRYARHTFPDNRVPAAMGVLFALFNPLPWIIAWMGQIEVFVLLSLLILPFGVPMLFLKPNIALFAALRSRRDILIMVGTLAVSFVIWGWWPQTVIDHILGTRLVQLGTMSWPRVSPALLIVGLPMFLLTDRDEMRLMAAGGLITPFMMAYHYYLLLPALGRTSGWRQVLIWVSTVFLYLASSFENVPVKALAQIFPVLVWLMLAPTLKPAEILADPDIILNRLRRSVAAIFHQLAPRPAQAD
jgi:hypothetical protein